MSTTCKHLPPDWRCESACPETLRNRVVRLVHPHFFSELLISLDGLDLLLTFLDSVCSAYLSFQHSSAMLSLSGSGLAPGDVVRPQRGGIEADEGES